jgi:hypothetical protein
MAILRERQVWKRKGLNWRGRLGDLDLLTPDEQSRVRTAMDVLRISYGDWRKVAKALGANRTTITRVVCLRRRCTPAFAARVAKLLGVPLGEILSGEFPKACPLCGARGFKVHSLKLGARETACEAIGRLRAERVPAVHASHK